MSHALLADLEHHDMAVDAFLEWSARQDGKWQLIDGVPSAMPPASRPHGSMQAETARLIGNWLAETRPHCAVVTEGGVIPRVSAWNNYRVPDVAVTCSPDLEGRHEVDAPLLVVEILSPSNQAQTWINLWAYASIPSIQEMVLVESERVEARLFQRQADQSWPRVPTVLGAADTIPLHSIGFSVPLMALYRTTRFAQP